MLALAPVELGLVGRFAALPPPQSCFKARDPLTRVVAPPFLTVPGLSLVTTKGRVEDNVPEDSALVFNTNEGIVILTGCGHAGIVNIVEYARTIDGDKPLLGVVGGLHLFAASDQTLAWTGARLKSYRIENLLAGHCTGIEATYRLRESTGLSRKTAMVSAVGSSFTLGRGIDARMLAQ